MSLYNHLVIKIGYNQAALVTAGDALTTVGGTISALSVSVFFFLLIEAVAL